MVFFLKKNTYLGIMASTCPQYNEKFDAQTAQQIKEKWDELYQYFNQKFGKVEFLFENQTLSIYTLQVIYSVLFFTYYSRLNACYKWNYFLFSDFSAIVQEQYKKLNWT